MALPSLTLNGAREKVKQRSCRVEERENSIHKRQKLNERALVLIIGVIMSCRMYIAPCVAYPLLNPSATEPIGYCNTSWRRYYTFFSQNHIPIPTCLLKTRSSVTTNSSFPGSREFLRWFRKIFELIDLHNNKLHLWKNIRQFS